jgi:hypothetical protein
LVGLKKPHTKIMSEQKLHPKPAPFFKSSNNRKITLGRMKVATQVQSIPIFEKDKKGKIVKLLGWKYIYHYPTPPMTHYAK